MKTLGSKLMVICAVVLTSQSMLAQKESKAKNETVLKTYLIEREIPNAGALTQEELKGISQKSCTVLNEMGNKNIQWLHSYVTENKVYCLYKAKSKELIKEHAEKGGFPVNNITELANTISPKTAQEN